MPGDMYAKCKPTHCSNCSCLSSSCYDRQRQLAMKRTLFWARRLQLAPCEVDRLTVGELEARLRCVQEAENAEEQRRLQYKRWQDLNELRWLMYEEQRKYNELSACPDDRTSIWNILANAQQELEQKLSLDQLRGNCMRFPSPMSLMEERVEGGRCTVLEPLRAALSGIHESDKGKQDHTDDEPEPEPEPEMPPRFVKACDSKTNYLRKFDSLPKNYSTLGVHVPAEALLQLSKEVPAVARLAHKYNVHSSGGDGCRCDEGVQTEHQPQPRPTMEQGSQTTAMMRPQPKLHQTDCTDPLLLYVKEKFNIEPCGSSSSGSSYQSIEQQLSCCCHHHQACAGGQLVYCPLCDARHLRLPHRF